MPFAANSLVALSYPQSVEIARQLNGSGTANADLLSKTGFAGPAAIEIVRQMVAGVGNVGALHRLGFAASDATVLAAAINSRGPN